MPVVKESANKESVIRELEGEPDLLALARCYPERYPFLLQSVAQSTKQVHYDILFAFPQYQIELTSNEQLHITGNVSKLPANLSSISAGNSPFLNTLDQHWRANTGLSSAAQQLPFEGGWFVYLGYELAQQIETGLELPQHHDTASPVAFAARVPSAIIINRTDQKSYIVCETGYEQLEAVVTEDVASVAFNSHIYSPDKVSDSLQIQSLVEEPGHRYIDQINLIKNYIREGDVFQVNLSRAWRGGISNNVSAFDIYTRLCQTNPAPFSCLVNSGDFSIISSSPERLVKVCNGDIETRPIAGTRPRGSSIEDDDSKLKELIGHPKERAEHIMLIDLERNDLGRVCVPGTIEVNELMVLETYAHVHHIVSNVRGKLRDGWTPGQVIAAVFPGGTITGCPKVRCMEIIAELEQVPRGAYTGSVGYINHNGNMDFNILIRTMTLSNNKLSLRAGAGIVADSDPEKELLETRAKAKGMLLALQ